MQNKEYLAAAARAVAEPLALEQGLELVDVTLQKEPQGRTLCLYIDKPGGVSLDDCERFHKAVQPLLETVDYDYLEVSSPGADRPVQTQRDFEKNRGALVEVRNGAFAGRLKAKVTEGIHPETVFMVHGFGHTLPVESRARGRGVADNELMPGGIANWDKGGGGVCMQEHFVTVEPA